MHDKVFVKGHLSFEFEGQKAEYIHRNVSLFGATGLAWQGLRPDLAFGKEVNVHVRIPHEFPLEFYTPAIILKEYTLYADYLGLRFKLEPENHAALSKLVQKSGFVPTEFIRKYPRIPQMAAIPTFPLRVSGLPASNLTPTESPVVFDVQNISPNGLLISTESPIALVLGPGQRLNLTLEPRGNFPLQVQVEGLICRITEDLHPESGNLVRSFGIKFTRVDEMNRAAFLDLLQDILKRLQSFKSNQTEET